MIRRKESARSRLLRFISRNGGNSEEVMEDPTPTPTPATPYNSFWKWQAMFDRPLPLETAWQNWLAKGQSDEQLAELRYWANRSPRG